MMEAVRTSETSVDNHFTRQYIPEDNSEHQILSYLILYFKWTPATLLVGKNYRLFCATGGLIKGSYYRLYLLILYCQQHSQFT
jgi:hypothetical protein